VLQSTHWEDFHVKTLTRSFIAALAGAVAVAVLVPAATAGADTGTATIYASPTGTSSAAGSSCDTAQYASIQDAIGAAPVGGTVVVCDGIYLEGVTVDKQLTLMGQPGAIINALHQPYGVGVAASYVTVEGLTVINASDAHGSPGDGIITAGFVNGSPVAADHVQIIGNTLKRNHGAGIDLNSTSYSVAVGNTSKDNGIGINVSDDLGSPASHNMVLANTANDNGGGCGIVLADHSGAGIFDNTISGNVADRNGLGSPTAPDASAGSGIILAAGSGGVYDNQVNGNTFDGNGHGGVALHAHAPGLNFSGNEITGNNIGTNNLRTDYADLETTGIYIADASPLTITVSGNLLHADHFGIFTAGDITVNGIMSNTLRKVDQRLGSTPVYGG
jgi:hypothetical protein